MAGLCSNLSNKFPVSYTKKGKKPKESTKGFFQNYCQLVVKMLLGHRGELAEKHPRSEL